MDKMRLLVLFGVALGSAFQPSIHVVHHDAFHRGRELLDARECAAKRGPRCGPRWAEAMRDTHE
jgi:hypothetical protein